MPTIFEETLIGVVLLVERHPYRFPLLLLVLAILGGCIFSPILRGRKDEKSID